MRIARALAAPGIGVLHFDFTGLGQSEGDFAESTFSGSVKGLLAAACAMQAAGIGAWLLIGHSLGGAAARAAASDLPALRAVAKITAPFDVQHVTRLFGTTLQTLPNRSRGQRSHVLSTRDAMYATSAALRRRRAPPTRQEERQSMS